MALLVVGVTLVVFGVLVAVPPRLRVHAVLYLALFGGLLFGLARQQSSVDTVREVSLEQCDRSNMIRAYLRQDASKNARQPRARRALADALFPLLDCPVVVATGTQERVPAVVEAAFIASVGRGRPARIRHGRVVVPGR